MCFQYIEGKEGYDSGIFAYWFNECYKPTNVKKFNLPSLLIGDYMWLQFSVDHEDEGGLY